MYDSLATANSLAAASSLAKANSLAATSAALTAAAIPGLICTVLLIVSYWKIFTKAGYAGWKSIIPIYNCVILFKIAGLNPWLLLLFIVPFVNFIAIPVLTIILCVKLSKAFGHGGGFAVGLILLSIVFYPILAFGSSTYVAGDTNVDPVQE